MKTKLLFPSQECQIPLARGLKREPLIQLYLVAQIPANT